MNSARLARMIVAILACGDSASAAVPPPATLRITIYDQANLPPDVMRTTSDHLRRIFQQSGIAIELVAGDPAADEASLFMYIGVPAKGQELEAACRARRDIALKITDISPGNVPGTVLGISAPLAPKGLNVRVYNRNIRQAALQHKVQYPIVLSYAIAHEIGHVLRRSNQHDESGLMSAIWTEREYEQMGNGGIVSFTQDESQRMLMIETMVCADTHEARNTPLQVLISTPPIFFTQFQQVH